MGRATPRSGHSSRGGRRRPFRAPEGPRQDDGLFGPGSMTWRVWTSASNYVAAYRSVIVQMLNPPIGHGVATHSDYAADPTGRLRRTGHYFAAYALGDLRTVEALSRQLSALHAKVGGTEPVTGASYRALEHDHLLYVHVTGWHSALTCYERFVAPLTDAERVQFWQEAGTGTEYIGFPGDLVPASPDEVREYFATVNPSLAYGQPAMDTIEWFKRPHVEHRRDLHTIPIARAIKRAVIPTLPGFIQDMTGLRQSRAADAVATAAGRTAVAALDRDPLKRLNWLAVPEAYELVESARRRQADHDAGRLPETLWTTPEQPTRAAAG